MKIKLLFIGLTIILIAGLLSCQYTWNEYWTPEIDPEADEIDITLLSPTDASTVGTITPTFQWQATPAGSMYHLMIDDNSDFSSPVVDKNDISSTSYTLSGTGGEILVNDTTYYWRVRAQDGEGTWGSWSEEDDFIVIDFSQGLVAYWPFNGNVNDESTNSNDGTVNGATLTTDRFGNANNAYSFDGSNDYVLVNHNSTLNPNNELTIEAWVFWNGSGLGDDQEIVSKETGYLKYGYQFRLANGFPALVICDGGDSGSAGIVKVDSCLNVGWHHILAIYNDDADYAKIYIDGNLVKENTTFTTVIDNSGNTDNLSIGNWYNQNGHWWNGLIDDIRIYNRVLSYSEIQAHSQEGGWTPPLPIPTDGLVAYYPFSGNAYDGSVNYNPGTVNGATLTTDRFGNTDSAYNFDGVDDYISVPDCTEHKIRPPLSISLWIKPENDFTGMDILSKGDGTFRYWYINLLQTSYLHFQVYGYNPSVVDNDLTITENKWYHLTTVHTGTNMKIYLNSIEGGNITTNFVSDNSSSNPLTIGADYDWIGSDWHFEGQIDDVRIYNRALTEDEIQALYQEGGWTGN